MEWKWSIRRQEEMEGRGRARGVNKTSAHERRNTKCNEEVYNQVTDSGMGAQGREREECDENGISKLKGYAA